MYFNCDALSSEKDIIDLIIEFIKTRQNQKTAIFLDEISSVSNWPQGVKWLVDAGQLKNATVFLSGEFLPGRRGGGKDIAFLPVGFYDYLKLKSADVEKIKLGDPHILVKARRFTEKAKKHYGEFIPAGADLNWKIPEDLLIETLLTITLPPIRSPAAYT